MADGRVTVAALAAREEWLARTAEEIIEPEREIVDPHHHLWRRGGQVYELDQLWADTATGHNIVQTMFIECFERYRDHGPDHMKPVGETEYAAAIARASAADPSRPAIAGIIAHADLRHEALDEVLDAHEVSAGALFRGVRHAGACDEDKAALMIVGRGVPGQYEDPAFRRGVARLGARGLTYDTWQYHHQLPAFRELCAACSGTTMVLDHFSTPLGVGRFVGKRAEIFAWWKDEVAALAELPNVVAKLGGLAMPDNGWGWHDQAAPVGSDEFAEAQAPWYHHMIACFGPERCMFESNFPVDRASVSYPVLWNALKKIAADYDEAAKQAMFAGTARRVYGLPEPA
jgi:predicted TIM-barrel fold metal-dependent hydrolase